MRKRPLGASGIEASIIGMGTWAIGGGVWGDEPDDDESIRAIHAAIDAGITLFDTAPVYGFGRSERVVGRAVADRRDKVVLATKCGLWWEDQRGSEHRTFDGRPLRRSARPDTIAVEIENSLRRLGTDYIDLYQLHWPPCEPEKTPAAETMDYLVKLKDAGKIRAIGVSNVTLGELEAYRRAGPVVGNQLRYSMISRDAEAELFPHCREHGLATITYMSLEQGLLTGKIGPERKFGRGEIRGDVVWNRWYRPKNRRRVLEMLHRWRDLTEKYDCSPVQLVVAWTLAQVGVSHMLCGARRAEQIRETAAGASLTLASEDIRRLRRDAEALGKPA